MSERGWIETYFAPLARAPGAARLSDDIAELSRQTRPVVITTDAMVEGVHFLASDPVESIARKLVRVNVSDILSSGALPLEALLVLGWPASRTEASLAAFAGALGAELETWGISLIGGDTVSAPGGLFLSLTLTGACLADAPVRRGGAAPGDELWVTGEMGGARLGFRARAAGQDSPHISQLLEPRIPGLDSSRLIATHASAAMDVSDGLLGDAATLARASGCGATLALDDVPFADQPVDLATALDLATWGDDYQLLFAVPESGREGLETDALSRGVRISRIGRLTSGAGLDVAWRGTPVNLPETLGFEHGRIGVSPTRP